MSLFDYVLVMLRRAAEHGNSWPVSPAEADAVVAEVEYLRSERTAVVAWLLKGGSLYEGQVAEWHDLWVLARAIERGEHRRKEET